MPSYSISYHCYRSRTFCYGTIIILCSFSALVHGQSSTSTLFENIVAQLPTETAKDVIRITLSNELLEDEVFRIFPRQVFSDPSPPIQRPIKAFSGSSVTSAQRTLNLVVSKNKVIVTIHDGRNLVFRKSNISPLIPSGFKSQNRLLQPTCQLLNKGNIGTSNEINRTSNELLEYKIAFTASSGFSQANGTSKEEVLLSIVSYLNQINNIFERELSIRLVLANSNEKVIYTDSSTDPFANTGSNAITIHQQILRDSIGESNYDLGHHLTLGGGGLANISVTCGEHKAIGLSGFEEAVNFHKLLAHEIGHQLGAGHSWNSCTNSLNGIQRSPSAAMEPGSGTTIMSYAGLCGANNIDNTREDYFHAISIQQITNYTRSSAGSCAQKMEISNTPPTIIQTPNNSRAIPKSTPFTLEGAAIDAEDQFLTYAWDQIDQSEPLDLGKQNTFSPLFRSRLPGIKGVRYFPQLTTLANNVSDPAAVLPLFDRTLEFRMIVRDNRSGNGNVATSDFTIDVDGDAGPFVVDDLLSNNSWTSLRWQPIYWDVANTDNARTDCQYVDILIDYEGLLEFQDTLAVAVPNDGLHYIQVPDTVASTARLMVKASDNLFFDISDQPFEIVRSKVPDFRVFMDTTSTSICTLEPVTFDIRTANENFFSNEIRFTTNDVPDGIEINFSSNDILAGNSTQMQLTFNENVERKRHEIIINAFAVNGTRQNINFSLDIKPEIPATAVLSSPPIGSTLSETFVPFSWVSNNQQAHSTIEVATSPTFETSSKILTTTTTLDDTEELLPNNSAFFWRVITDIGCGEKSISEIGTFGIKATSCALLQSTNQQSINANRIDSITSSITVDSDIIIQDINIKNITGTHSFIGDLTFMLITPDDQIFILVEQECNESRDFNFSIGTDESRLRCPINRGFEFEAAHPLTSLIGMNAKGQWTLKIIDNAPGDGGILEGWELELCSFDNPNIPSLIQNDTLKLLPGGTAVLTEGELLYSDNDNTPAEITYIITQEVSNGYLINDQDTLTIGDQFTQSDINAGRLRYVHRNSSIELDFFKYTVTDGAGSSSPIKTQWISMQLNVGIVDLKEDLGIVIFPNPVSNLLQIINNNIKLTPASKITISTISGQTIFTKILPSDFDLLTVDTSNWIEGIYVIKISSDKQFGIQKIIVLR